MTIRHTEHAALSTAGEHTEQLILDGTKMPWHTDRVRAWERGERFAPITIDMALTRACNYACGFCYAMLQENDRQTITRDVMYRFLDDCAEVGVKAISLVSDGESTLSPAFMATVKRGVMTPSTTRATRRHCREVRPDWTRGPTLSYA